MINHILENRWGTNYILIALVFVAFVIVKIIESYKRRKLEKDDSLIKVTFNENIHLAPTDDNLLTDGLLVYQVNDATPILADNTLFIKYGLNNIILRYCEQELGLFKNKFALYDPIIITIDAKYDKEYKVTFNIAENSYRVREIEK
ncbi:hypothetical protein [Fusobacterium sp. PH5-44]|uniref:hypothetical protein n=1 Tax=unclassified Fusobacterium TaxID=2648384 RepID=UPI003D1F377F